MQLSVIAAISVEFFIKIFLGTFSSSPEYTYPGLGICSGTDKGGETCNGATGSYFFSLTDLSQNQNL